MAPATHKPHYAWVIAPRTTRCPRRVSSRVSGRPSEYAIDTPAASALASAATFGVGYLRSLCRICFVAIVIVTISVALGTAA